MWTLLSFAFLSTVAVSSSLQLSSHRDMIKQMVNGFLPSELKPSYKEIIETNCQRNADSGAFNNFMSVWSNAMQDIPASTLREAAKNLEYGETLKSVDIYCKLSPKIKKSSTKLLSAFKPCVEPDDREELYNNKNIFNSFMDYICFNSSEIVKTFLKNGGEECIREKESELKKCYFNEREYKIVNDNDKKIFESTRTMTKEELRKARNDKECRMKKIFQTCLKKVLDQCPSPSTSTFIFGLMERMPGPMCN